MHNHAPDIPLLQKLKLKKKLLTAAENSTAPLNQVFKDVARGEQGAGLVGFGNMSRYTSKFPECM